MSDIDINYYLKNLNLAAVNILSGIRFSMNI